MLHSLDSAEKRLRGNTHCSSAPCHVTLCSDFVSGTGRNLYSQWQNLGKSLKKLRQQIMRSQAFAFSFDEVYTHICMFICGCVYVLPC